MTDEEARNADTVRRQEELLVAGRLDEAAALFSDPFSNHGRAVPRRLGRAIFADIRTTFPDFSSSTEALVASGATVVVRRRFRGTHKGVGRLPINGGLMIGVPPTGKFMDVQHIHWYELAGGLITAHWANRDDVAMMQQLGLLSPVEFDYATLGAPPPAHMPLRQ